MKSCIRTLAQVLGGKWSNSTTKEEVEAFMAGEHPGPGLNDFRLAFQCPTSDNWNLTAAQVFSTIWHHYLQTIALYTIQSEFIGRYKSLKRSIAWPMQTVTLECQIGRQLKLSETVA